MSKKVLVTLPFKSEMISGFESCVKMLTDAGFEVELDSRLRTLAKDELIDALQGVYAHVAAAEVLSEEVMKSARSLKIISRMGVGYDNVDLSAATKYGIALTITPGANADAVAEYTVTLLLALTRNITTIDSMAKEGIWKTVFGTSVYGKTIGIIGAGNIGRRVVRNLSGFSMRVLAHDPFPNDKFAEEYGVSYCQLDTLLRESDYITIHSPLNEQTFHMIGKEQFSIMKPTALLVNCARGEIVDEGAMYDALHEKRIAGAALDVYEQEPFASDNPLLALENVIISPHIAGMTYECRKTVIEMAFQNIIDLSLGKRPEGLINDDVIFSE